MKTKTLLNLYLIESILDDPLFWGPVLILALSKLGHMSNEQIFLSEAFATGLILILDAPSGMLADLIGRKKCVIIGKILFLISLLFMAFMTSPIHGYIANAFWAIGVSLKSGADSALIYDELKKRNALDEYKLYCEKQNSYSFLLAALTTLSAGFIAEIDLRLPMILSIPGVLISTILVFFFPKEERKTHEHSFANYKLHMLDAYKEVLNNKILQTLLLWFAILGVLGKIYFFTYNPYLEMVKIPYSEIGFIFCGINIFAYVASKYAFKIQEKLGNLGVGLIFIFQGIIMLVQASFVNKFSGLLFVLAGGVRWGYMSTISGPVLNSEIQSEKRATVLSFYSSFSSMLQVIVFVIASPLSGNIPVLLAVIGVTSLALGFISRKV